MTETDISAIWADSLLLELYMYRQNQHRSTGGWYVFAYLFKTLLVLILTPSTV